MRLDCWKSHHFWKYNPTNIPFHKLFFHLQQTHRVSVCECVNCRLLPLTLSIPRTSAPRGPRSHFVFQGNAWLCRRVETARGLGEISSRRQPLLMTQMKYEGIVCERAEQKVERSSLAHPSAVLWWIRFLPRAPVVTEMTSGFRLLPRRAAGRDSQASTWRLLWCVHGRDSSQFYPLIPRFYRSAPAPLSRRIFYSAPLRRRFSQNNAVKNTVTSDGSNRRWPVCPVLD